MDILEETQRLLVSLELGIDPTQGILGLHEICFIQSPVNLLRPMEEYPSLVVLVKPFEDLAQAEECLSDSIFVVELLLIHQRLF